MDLIPNDLVIQIALYTDNPEDLLQLFNLNTLYSYLQLINYRYPKYLHKNLHKYDTKSIYLSLITLENIIKNRTVDDMPYLVSDDSNIFKNSYIEVTLDNYEWAECSLATDEKIYPLVRYMMLEKFVNVYHSNIDSIIIHDDLETFINVNISNEAIYDILKTVSEYHAINIQKHIFSEKINLNLH